MKIGSSLYAYIHTCIQGVNQNCKCKCPALCIPEV